MYKVSEHIYVRLEAIDVLECYRDCGFYYHRILVNNKSISISEEVYNELIKILS